MKNELPQWALWVAIVAGLVIIGGVAFSAFGGGGSQMTNDERIVAEKQAEISEQRTKAYISGNSGGTAPEGPPPSGEAAARAGTSGQSGQ
ncbi:MAG: hypothetical protein MUC92_12900 [Fimbriimonadaceae bacterium]|jgi:hypothetical protein|nr:hypothetical protein [Fimbriimonadaceae bacterium]